MGLLSYKVAPVTGAARGIGPATARACVEAGAQVVMLEAADPDAVPPVDGFRIAKTHESEMAHREVRAIAPDTIEVVGDVRAPADLDGAVRQAVEAFGGSTWRSPMRAACAGTRSWTEPPRSGPPSRTSTSSPSSTRSRPQALSCRNAAAAA